jgi:hypothetical protein
VETDAGLERETTMLTSTLMGVMGLANLACGNVILAGLCFAGQLAFAAGAFLSLNDDDE